MTIAALRYNNPGNISLPLTGWTGGGRIVGLAGQPGYAEFPTMPVGYEAFLFRLNLFITTGQRDTIRTIGQVYAADPRWPLAVSELSGIGLDTPINPDDGEQMNVLAAAIVKQETGMTIAELCAQAVSINIPIPAAPAPATPAAEAATQEPPMAPTSTAAATATGSTSLFGGLIPWAEGLIGTIATISSKGNTELTTFEAAVKSSAPAIASAVDGLLTAAETVTAIIDPPAEQAIASLKTLFDGLVSLVEQGAGAA